MYEQMRDSYRAVSLNGRRYVRDLGLSGKTILN
jgi:hypothetical protein